MNIPDVSSIDINKFNSKSSKGPEYIPYNTRGRDIFGRLSFNTGVLWLGGFVAGGSYGFVEGWKKAASPNYKIKFNSIMNALSKRGTYAGNMLGIIAFVHTASVWVADELRLEDISGTSIATPVFSGAITGALVASARGPRAAALAGVIGSAVSSAYWYGGSILYNDVLGKYGRF